MNTEQYSTSTDRIKPPKQVNNPVHINLDDLEALREREQAQRRERVFDFNNRGW